MNLKKVYLKEESAFTTYLMEWSQVNDIEAEVSDITALDESIEGVIIITANQDIDKETNDLIAAYDKKHIPIRKIDVNGTLQVAVSNFDLWMRNNKCSTVLMLGADDLVKNNNLDRFFKSIEGSIA